MNESEKDNERVFLILLFCAFLIGFLVAEHIFNKERDHSIEIEEPSYMP